ncbi:MAG: hypothetical protein ACP5E3_01460 [Bacteroidales bacterium]
MREEQYMLIMIRLIEEKTGWGNIDEWTNYNFSLLSDEIKKTTGKRISDSTLKRIFGKKKTNSEIYRPHVYTKNIIAEYLGYQNWDEFRKDHRKDEPIQNFRPKYSSRTRRNRIILFVVVAIIIIVAGVFVYSKSISDRKNVNPVISMDCENSVGRIPFTAVFNYQLEDTQDSILIDFGNNEEYFLSPKRNMITQFYPGADYTTVRVSRGDEIICTRKVHILSNGWQAGFSPSDTLEAYRPFENQEIKNAGGRLFIKPDYLSAEGIRPIDNNFIEYRYFDKFETSLDDISFETIVKNSAEEGGKRCYDIEIILKGENSNFIVRFLEPGCFRYVRFNVGEKRYFGRFHDLSAFARDVSDWRNIKVKIKDGLAEVYFEDELIRSEPYEEDMGEFKGIIYRFFGNGSVDFVRLESENEIILEDEF